MVKSCVICGREIITCSSRRSVCSEECRRKRSWNQQKKSREYIKLHGNKHYPEVKCGWCGVVFIPRTKDQKRCSTECSRLYLDEFVYKPKRQEASKSKSEKKKRDIEQELKGRTFAQALAEKYGLNLEE